MGRLGGGKGRVEMMSIQSGVRMHEIPRGREALINMLYKRRAEILGLPLIAPPPAP